MIIYTDGSSHPNPGPGGFGVVVLDDNENFSYNYSKQFDNKTTNNEMELKAILYAMLNHGSNNGKDIPIVYSDSNYSIQTLNNWMFTWAKNNWIKSDKKQPENLNLIKAYYNLYQKGYRIDLRKVKGHARVYWNEIADKLAAGEFSEDKINKYFPIKLTQEEFNKIDEKVKKKHELYLNRGFVYFRSTSGYSIPMNISMLEYLTDNNHNIVKETNNV